MKIIKFTGLAGIAGAFALLYIGAPLALVAIANAALRALS